MVLSRFKKWTILFKIFRILRQDSSTVGQISLDVLVHQIYQRIQKSCKYNGMKQTKFFFCYSSQKLGTPLLQFVTIKLIAILKTIDQIR
jgi:hypothetical protein